MTARGSIIYYLAAIICGSFFLALTFQIYYAAIGGDASRWARSFFFLYFLALMLAFLPLMLTAFALRRLARRYTWRGAWQWLLAGCTLGLGVLWSLGGLAVGLERLRLPDWFLDPLLFSMAGALLAVNSPFWLPVPALAATSWVLMLVQRAFEPQSGARAQGA